MEFVSGTSMLAGNGSTFIFPGLLGQEKAKMLLTRALTADRVPHALLFRGPDGVGKQRFARAVAAWMNCRGKVDGGACGQCSSCRKFHSGNHPDFTHIGPVSGTIKIDRIRELSRALTYPSYEAVVRVVLLEDIHTMRREAANSLLKTLEEPPEGNLLILTAEDKESGLDATSATLLARLAEGSPGRALLLQRMNLVQIWRKVVTVVTDCGEEADGGTSVLLRTAEELAALKDGLIPFLGLLRIWLRDRLMAEPGLGQRGIAVASGGPADGLFVKLEAIDRAERELARNCNRTLVCEILLFRLQRTEGTT